MAESRLNLEPEVQEILKCIDNGQHFLLSGGAGSGKTFSLVQLIRQILIENPIARIACITYTNAAVKEIEHRVKHKNLSVLTIHDFLWANIKRFQKEMSGALASLINDENPKLRLDEELPIPYDYFLHFENGIQYKSFVKLKEGVISHDELLLVAHLMFELHPGLSSIVKDKFNFILIDEYQDTSPLVIDIFLKHFPKSRKKNIIGFFGDSMQSIYDDGVGNIQSFLGGPPNGLSEIQKHQNRRNPRKIYELANRLRTDGIKQVHSDDLEAPNMSNGKVKDGEMLFLYSRNVDYEYAKETLSKKFNWDFGNPKKTKELNLTYDLIAQKSGFGKLYDVYTKDPIINLKNDILSHLRKCKEKGEIVPNVDSLTFGQVVDELNLKSKGKAKKEILLEDPHSVCLFEFVKDRPFSEISRIFISKESLLDNKKESDSDNDAVGSNRDKLIRHLCKIQNNIHLYKSKRFNEFLRETDFRYKLINVRAKIKLKEHIEDLLNIGDKTIGEVITAADEKGICIIDDHLRDFIKQKEYIFYRVRGIKFSEFQNSYNYVEGYTPFSTQHKTKGSEYDDVFVVLDNNGWSKYNFNYLFDQENEYQDLIKGKSKTKKRLDAFPGILNRTRKLFYVCCTRAKERLAVYYHNPSPGTIATAESWFGPDNVVALDE